MTYFSGLLVPICVSLLLMVYFATIGFVVNHPLNLWVKIKAPAKDVYLAWFFALSSGMLITIAVMFILGIMGLINGYAVFGSLGALFTGSVVFIFRHKALRRDIFSKCLWLKPSFKLEYLALLTLYCYIVFHCIRVPGDWDDTMYHLPLARYYLDHHAIVLDAFARYPLFPQNIELLFILGLMINGVILAQCLANLPLFILCIGLVGAGKSFCHSRLWGYVAVVLLLLCKPVVGTLGYAYIDSGLALFSWGALLALAMWESSHRLASGWLLLSGALVGGAVGSKYFGCVIAVLLGVWIILYSPYLKERRKSNALWRCNWKAVSLYGLAAGLLGSWWYIRNIILSGDPIHPAGGHLFGFFLWDAQDLMLQKQEQATNGVTKSLFYLWPALHKAGISLWILALCSLGFIKKASSSVRLIQYTFGLYFLFWLYATQVNRYIAPIAAAGSFLSVYFLYQLDQLCFSGQSLKKLALLGELKMSRVLSRVILLSIIIFCSSKAINHIRQWNVKLYSLSGYELFDQANHLMSKYGDKIVQIGFENRIYFYQGTAIGDVFGLGRYRNMMSCQKSCQLIPPTKMIALMNRFGSHLLIINTKLFFTFDLAAYQRYFIFLKSTNSGILMTPK